MLPKVQETLSAYAARAVDTTMGMIYLWNVHQVWKSQKRFPKAFWIHVEPFRWRHGIKFPGTSPSFRLYRRRKYNHWLRKTGHCVFQPSTEPHPSHQTPEKIKEESKRASPNQSKSLLYSTHSLPYVKERKRRPLPKQHHPPLDLFNRQTRLIPRIPLSF